MIRIAHLYPYELDLYGENGNIKALTYMLKEKNIDYEIINIFPHDELELDNYDFIYIGSGRKDFLEKVYERLLPYKEQFLKYISMDKVMLVTGNAVRVFEFLNLYSTKYYEIRKVSNVKGTCSLCKGIIEGFQNTEYLIDSTDHILFQLDQGFGNNDTLMEGYHEHRFFATSLIGPILARNDKLCEYMIQEIVESKNE